MRRRTIRASVAKDIAHAERAYKGSLGRQCPGLYYGRIWVTPETQSFAYHSGGRLPAQEQDVSTGSELTNAFGGIADTDAEKGPPPRAELIPRQGGGVRNLLVLELSGADFLGKRIFKTDPLHNLV